MVPVDVLRQYFDTTDVNRATLDVLSGITSERCFEAGEIIFREEEQSSYLYIITRGQVDVQYLLKSGKRRTFDTLGPGEFLVWSAVIKPHRTTSIGISRAKTTVLTIEAAPLRKLCEDDTRFGYRLLSQLAQSVRHRLQGARRQLGELE